MDAANELGMKERVANLKESAEAQATGSADLIAPLPPVGKYSTLTQANYQEGMN